MTASWTREVEGWLRVGMLNVRGLGQRGELVREFMTKERLDVLILNETMLRPERKPSLGCQAVVLNKPPVRQGARSGGGTAILIKEGIVFHSPTKEFYRQTELITLLCTASRGLAWSGSSAKLIPTAGTRQRDTCRRLQRPP